MCSDFGSVAQYSLERWVLCVMMRITWDSDVLISDCAYEP